MKQILLLRARRGFTLLETIIALGILSVPVILLMTLMESGVTGTQFTQERLSAQLVLNDLAALIQGQPLDKIKQIGAGGTGEIDLLMEGRVAALPDHLRDGYRKQLQPLMGNVTLSLTEDAGGLVGLFQLRLTARLSRNATLEETWTLRPERRLEVKPDIERL